MTDINVYTDGACSNNGYAGAKAGIGIFFGFDDTRNVSERVVGKQTNNVAELMAIIKVVEILHKEIIEKKKITIYSDSIYAIRACTAYGKVMAEKGWKKNIPNLELVKRAFETFQHLSNITFKHIKAHSGLQDEHSIGNENADALANQAIGGPQNIHTIQNPQNIHNMKTTQQKQNTQKNKKRGNWKTWSNEKNVHSRLFLNVPYKQKEKAKKQGCRWDASKKKWYILSSCSKEKLERVLDTWGTVQTHL